jgi:hypothetical protein
MDNILAPAVFEQPTAQAIEQFYKESTGHLWVKGKDELVIHITDLFLMEDPAMLGTEGNIDLRIQAFVKRGDKYYSIHKLDKQEFVEAFDVTQKMFKILTTYLSGVLDAANSKYTPELDGKTAYTWDQVMQIRQKELIDKYGVYTATSIPEGVYQFAESFHNLEPDFKLKDLDAFIQTNLAKPKKKREILFAYCKDNKLYFFKDVKKYETVEVYRRDNNFFMQDYGLDPALQATASTLGWLVGFGSEMIATAASNGNRSWYEFVYNPRNSTFYQYKKLAATKEGYLSNATAVNME